MKGCRRGKKAAEERLRTAREDWGWRPHTSQREWLVTDADVKVAACGRRWGKTEAAAFDAATFAIQNPKSVQMIVSPTYDQSRLVFGTVERLMLVSEKHREKTKVVKTPYPLLTYSNGSVIMARTADDDGRNLRGHSADRVIVDEAAYVRDEVVEEVISPMLADRNGRLILISTPFGRNHFYRAFVRGQEGHGRYRSFQFPSVTNPYISREYIEAQREFITERQYAVEYEAEFIDDQNAVFKWNEIQDAVQLWCGIRAGKIGNEPYLVAGVDWARYSDYSAVVVLDVSQDLYRVVRTDRFNQLPWETQVERVIDTLESLNVEYVLMDQTSVGDPLLELTCKRAAELGLNSCIQGVSFTNASKREMIDNLALLFSCKRMALRSDELMVKELQFYEYELTSAGNIRMNARRGYTDDLVCALALAAQAGKQAPGRCRVMTSGENRVDIVMRNLGRL